MTQDAGRSRRGTGLSVAGWPLARKLALALAIPLLLAVVLGGLRVAGDYTASRSAARSATQVEIIQPAVDYLISAETAMVAAQNDNASSQGDLIDAIDDITTDAEALTQARDSSDLDELQTAQVNSLLDLSQSMRAEGAANLGPATWVALTRQLESSVSQLITSVNAAQDTPEPRLEQLSQTMSGRLSLALQQGLLATTLAQSSSQDLFSELGVEAAAIDRLAGSVEGVEEQTSALRTANTAHASQIREDKGTNFGGRDAYAPYDEITEKLISGVTASLDDAAGAAQRNALIGALLTLLALGAAIALALMVARSLLEPIGKVREGALAVARHRLPDAVARIRAGQEPEPIKTIDVTTNEEIGQVARAVDDLHRQAIHLASGEAQLRQTVNAMFVTLSRRSTSLVNQQLAQIERLEHDEEDPKRLESLFRLDHLASRMRRTADSLLILADAPNRAAGQFSLSVGEALQAATSGVQDYQRVQILSHLNTRVSEQAAPDVVHLLTELVDNALTFSPPSEPVRLAAKLGPEGATITITDSGLGVPPSELEMLNSDLQHGAEATPDTARRMGLFVVSRLAERHDIDVTLARNPGGGMTANVLLPNSVLPDVPQVSAAPVAAATAVAATAAAAPAEPEVLETGAVSAAAESKREARNRARMQKAEARSARRDAKELEPVDLAKPATEAPAEAPAAAAVSEPTPDRPPLDSLLPRREPGANMPRTGADAFLPPETSGVTGPLFGKRAEQTEATDGESGERRSPAENVARVVPITALAARQRAQAEEEARRQAEPADEVEEVEQADETVVDETVAEDATEAAENEAAENEAAESEAEPVVAQADPLSDPLSDPMPTDEADEADTAEEPEAPDEVVAEETADAEPEAQREDDDVEVDANDPLGLDTPARAPEPAAVEELVEEPVEEPAAEEAPAAEAADEAADDWKPAPAYEPVAEPAAEPVAEPAAEEPAAPAAAVALAERDPLQGEPVRSGGESPIFKSMRSGWLASEGQGEFHETEVDRGWQVAEQAAEAKPAVEATPVGLPRRAPGERLVPGSVTPPTASKTRDPEAIRRRLQAHSAGVSRGRRAAQTSTQHTEAGPA